MVLGRGENPIAASPVHRCFADDYAAAREKFRHEAQAGGLRLQSVEHPERGPGGEELALDAAATDDKHDRLLVISSGLHGVEGPLGSALQVHQLQHDLIRRADEAGFGLLLLHALNPFGFAHRRRWDHNNIDCNRNFLLNHERPEGAPPIYAELDGLLNPRRKPPWHDGFSFYLRAAAAAVRHSFEDVKQAVAEGQFEFPDGLFYGGSEPSWTNRALREHLPQWLRGRARVIHFDIHSGLGRWGGCQLLLDFEPRPWQRQWMERYDSSQWQASDPSGDAYEARGPLGKWLDSQYHQQEYLYLCAEFGTHGPMQVLRWLRLENQAWQAGDRDESVAEGLQQMFCPRSPRWRKAVTRVFEARLGRALAE